MEMNEYQAAAARTRNHDITRDEQRTNYALGLAGESGELANVVKKHIYHGHDIEVIKQKVLDESGDCMWYLAELLAVYDLTLEDAARHNVAKLQKRYEDGFSQEASQNRAV